MAVIKTCSFVENPITLGQTPTLMELPTSCGVAPLRNAPNPYDEIIEGQTSECEVRFTQEFVAHFVELSGDVAPVHVDEMHARKMGYSALVVHGFLVGVPYSRLLGMFLPGGNSVIHSLQLKMPSPVMIGDTVRYSVRVQKKIPAVKAVQMELFAINHRGQEVSRGTALCVFPTVGAAP